MESAWTKKFVIAPGPTVLATYKVLVAASMIGVPKTAIIEYPKLHGLMVEGVPRFVFQILLPSSRQPR